MARKFFNPLDSFNLNLHVKGVIHQSGHTLDLVITRLDESLISDLTIDSYRIMRQLFSVMLLINPGRSRRPSTIEAWKKIDFAKFCEDLSVSVICAAPPVGVAELVSTYNSELIRILDEHTRRKSKLIYDRTNCNWYTNELGGLKCHKRKLDRRHKASKLAVDLDIYKEASSTYEK